MKAFVWHLRNTESQRDRPVYSVAAGIGFVANLGESWSSRPSRDIFGQNSGSVALHETLQRSFQSLNGPDRNLGPWAMGFLFAGVLLLTPGFFTDAMPASACWCRAIRTQFTAF